MRQGAAWPTERLSRPWQCCRQSRAGRYLIVAEPSSLPSAASAVHRSTVRRPSGRSSGRGGPGCLSGACRVEVALSEYSVASTRPVSGVRVNVQCPRM